MKKVQLLIAAAVLVSGSAFAQGTNADGFRSVNDCIGCTVDAPVAPTVNETNSKTYTPTSIDNCSVVIQGGTGVNRGDDNQAVVDQSGQGNAAALYQREGSSNYGKQLQIGDGNDAEAIVWGSGNTTVQLQRGNGNKASINVDEVIGSPAPPASNNGDNNWAQQRQSTNNNSAEIDQLGDANLASQDQFGGNGNLAKIEQKSWYSTAVQIQNGTSNEAVTLQGRMGGAEDDRQRSSIEQGGDRNQAIVRQDR